MIECKYKIEVKSFGDIVFDNGCDYRGDGYPIDWIRFCYEDCYALTPKVVDWKPYTNSKGESKLFWSE